MIITPLEYEQNGFYVSRVKDGSTIYATDSDHNLTQGKGYNVIKAQYSEVLVKNDIGNEEWYTHEWFSMTKPV